VHDIFSSRRAAALAATGALMTSLCAMAAGAEQLVAEDGVLLQEVEVTALRDLSALNQAPTESRLDAMQPQSVISIERIANTVVPTADYATIANLAPGVSNVETNGPGLSESKHLTMRGFDDNSYNVTYDGIPFGDQNDWSHHTTSYFPAKLVGKVVVDRGPGTASTIGQATFGGTIAMYSKDPREDMVFVPTLSRGSWDTNLAHFEFNTGRLASINNGSAIMSYQHMTTDGYRTASDMQRDTYYLKYLQPLSENTVVTVLATYNRIHFSNPGTVTQQQIDSLGRNYGLSTIPGATDNKLYNFQDKWADFEYLGVDSHLSEHWELSNRVYSYYYNNESRESPKTKTVSGVIDNIGSYKVNRYRNFGDHFLLTRRDDTGVFKAGFWYDYTRNPRYLYGLNYTTTGNTAVDLLPATNQFAAVAANPVTATGAPDYNYSYDMTEWARTLQAFVDYEWHAGALTLDGGLKSFRFKRDIEAAVNQTKARKPLYFSHTDSKVLPYLSANYLFTPAWSGYAQVAQGMLSPNLNQFYVDVPDSNTIKPAETMNYQVGTVYKTDRFNADADIYYIDFKNYAYKGPTNSSGDPIYIGVAQGAKYSGAELEATYYVGSGFSLYGNYSMARARFKGSDLDVPTVPKSTMALGFVYDRHGFFSSFTDKFVDSWAVYDTLTNPDAAGGGASRRADSDKYWLAELSLGYSASLRSPLLKSYKLRLQLSNLFDKKVQVLNGIDALPANAYTKDSFNVLPERSYFLTLSGEL
jgi:iron complex outermembrane receptor protein